MQEEDQIIRIEAYLSGKLTVEERSLFESDCATDPAMNKLFLQHRFFLDGIRGMQTQAMKEKLSPSNSGTGKHHRWRVWLVVLVSLVLLVLLYLTILRPSPMQRLAKERYSAPFAEVIRSERRPQDALLQKGMEAYDRKDWKEAITAFSEIPDNHQNQEQAEYYRAHALVGAGEIQEAHLAFVEIAVRQGKYKQQAEWNLILTNMMLDAPKGVIKLQIVAIAAYPDHFYHDQAQTLLNLLQTSH